MRPTDEALVSAARQAKEKAYAPYSHFSVGAAVDGDDLLSLLGLSDVDESLLQCLLQTVIHNL